MNFDFQITATIVIYNQDLQILQKAVTSFLNIPLKKKLFIIDNASSQKIDSHFHQSEIEYFFLDRNLGFGRAHNLIINKLNSSFHLILNPDIQFNISIIDVLIKKLRSEKNTTFITPKIIYPNSDIQFVCRKHPTILNLLKRKLGLSKDNYLEELKEQSFYPEFIHGCFMLFKTKDLKELNGFDERYFLYLEDADICREIEKSGKTILYYPKVEAIHHHQRGSAKSPKLFLIHTISAIKYFLKWGFK